MKRVIGNIWMLILFFMLAGGVIKLMGQTFRPSLDSIKFDFKTPDWNVVPAPQGLPSLDAYNSNWNALIEIGLEDFTRHHLSGGKVRWDYGAFSLNGYIPLGGMFEEFVDDIAVRIFESQELQELLYEWASPYYLKAFSKLPYDIQIQYVDILRDAESYMLKFDLNKEREDLSANGDRFAWDKGKLNAFLFRRVNNGQMTVQDCLVWIRRILEDMKPYIKDPDYAPSFYDDVKTLEDGYMIFMRFKSFKGIGYREFYGVLYPNGKELMPADYTWVSRDTASNTWVVYRSDSLGVADREGRLIFFGKYDLIWPFRERNLAIVGRKVSEWNEDPVYHFGFFNRNGKMVYPAEYTLRIYCDYVYDAYEESVFLVASSGYFMNGFDVLGKNSLFGVGDTNGRIIIPIIYSCIRCVDCFEGSGSILFLVNSGGEHHEDIYNYGESETKGGKWALFDAEGTNLTGFIYDELRCNESQTGIEFKKGLKRGMLDEKGRVIKGKRPSD